LKYKQIAVPILILVIVLPLFVVANLTHASGTATGTFTLYSPDGSTITIPAEPYPVGQEIQVSLKISGASHVWSWHTEVHWNADVLTLTSVAEGTFLKTLPNAGTLPTGTGEGVWKNSNGDGYINGGLNSARLTRTETANNQGTLATLYFLVTASGTCGIEISGCTVYDKNSVETVAAITTSNLFVTVEGSYTGPSIEICDSSGIPQTTFEEGYGIYVKGHSLCANMIYDFYTVPHQESWENNGFDLTQGYTIDPVPVNVDELGNIALTNIVSSATTGEFDIVMDGYYSGLYSSGAGDIVYPSIIVTESSGPQPTPTPTPSQSPPVENTLTVTSNIGGSVTFNSNELIGSPIKIAAGQSQQFIVPNGCNVTLTGNGTSGGYFFTSWVGTGSIPALGGTVSQTFNITQDSEIIWNWAKIDSYTNKGGQGQYVSSAPFSPDEKYVTLAASLLINGNPAANYGVGFYVYKDGTLAAALPALTNDNGNAFSTYWFNTGTNESVSSHYGFIAVTASLNLNRAFVNDTCTFGYGRSLTCTALNVTKGGEQTNSSSSSSFDRYGTDPIIVSVTVSNVEWTAKSFYLTATIYDTLNVPVAYSSTPLTINPVIITDAKSVHYQVYNLSLNIPRYAFVGTANVYVNLYEGDPLKYPTPLCPELSTEIIIVANGAGQ
jgi:hypothetical protein